MKRCFALVLSLILLLSLAACGGKGQAPASEPSPSQGGGEVISGGESSPGTSSNAPSNALLGESGGQSVIENIPQEEQEVYIKKYIQPYHLVGLMYTTWSDPEEIEVWRYMHFFTYNEDENYYTSLGYTLYQDHSVPAEVVEEYVARYFEVSPAYLRTSEKYDASANCYRSMANEGIGGGPPPDIERIEKDGDIWKFICRDISDNLLSVTIRVEDESSFHYIAGEVLERAEQPKAEERFDPMPLGDHANILTEHIVSTVYERNGEYNGLDEGKFTHFAMGLVRFLEDEAYLYRDVAFRGNNGLYYFREEYLKNMMWEVFGAEDWEPDRENWSMEYDEVRQEYIIDLAFDFWNLVECKIMATLIDTQDMKVIVDYDLYTSSLFPDQHKIAAMSTDYAILFREDGTPYLRYAGTVANPPQE